MSTSNKVFVSWVVEFAPQGKASGYTFCNQSWPLTEVGVKNIQQAISDQLTTEIIKQTKNLNFRVPPTNVQFIFVAPAHATHEVIQ